MSRSQTVPYAWDLEDDKPRKFACGFLDAKFQQNLVLVSCNTGQCEHCHPVLVGEKHNRETRKPILVKIALLENIKENIAKVVRRKTEFPQQ